LALIYLGGDSDVTRKIFGPTAARPLRYV